MSRNAVTIPAVAATHVPPPQSGSSEDWITPASPTITHREIKGSFVTACQSPEIAPTTGAHVTPSSVETPSKLESPTANKISPVKADVSPPPRNQTRRRIPRNRVPKRKKGRTCNAASPPTRPDQKTLCGATNIAPTWLRARLDRRGQRP